MFKFLFRKTVLRKHSKEDQDFEMLLADKYHVEFLSQFMLYFLVWMPVVMCIILFVAITPGLFNYIALGFIVFMYLLLSITFQIRFKNEIKTFQILIANSMYRSEYVLQGKALSADDFKQISENNPKLFKSIMLLETHGYCYSVCFSILQCVKEGMMLFAAVKDINSEDEDEQHEYTMHVLYVNNQWCYDTYSQRQYPVDYVLEKMKAIPYISFGYENIGEMTYEEFRDEHAPALEVWCKAHDCHQSWKE